jgi:hypothetical protein
MMSRSRQCQASRRAVWRGDRTWRGRLRHDRDVPVSGREVRRAPLLKRDPRAVDSDSDITARFGQGCPKGMAMRVHFSTEDLPPGDRIRFWCDCFAQAVHSFTPREIPDASAFHAEASGQIAGEFALLDFESGLEKVRRTGADVARDKVEAFYIRRFRRPVIGRAGPRSTSVDLVHAPGDFCGSSTEWQFDAEPKGAASFEKGRLALADTDCQKT